MVEPFRPYIVYFLTEYCKILSPEDFRRAFVKNKVPRYFLKHEATWNLIENLSKHLFEAYIPQQINRKVGFKMQFETLIDECASNLAKTLNSPSLKIAETTFPKPLPYHEKQWTTSTSSPSFCMNARATCYREKHHPKIDQNISKFGLAEIEYET